MKNSSFDKNFIDLELLAEPREFRMSERDQFIVGIRVINRGSEIIDPEVFTVKLLINGEESLIWNETVANGTRDSEWFALPPGETVEMRWLSMGELFFPSPGRYNLVLKKDVKENIPVVVNVLP